MLSFGLRLSVHIVTLNLISTNPAGSNSSGYTHGLATIKENKKAVLSQLTAVSLTPKYSADVVETGANVNH